MMRVIGMKSVAVAEIIAVKSIRSENAVFHLTFVIIIILVVVFAIVDDRCVL
jgi:hypothetical protein